jgi:hypothetical protein
MTQSKRHYFKKKYNKSHKTKKRGGGTPPNETTPDESKIEEGQKYGKDISAPSFLDPRKFNKKQKPSSKLTSYTPEQTETFFTQRETADDEYNKLMKTHQETTEKEAERKRVQQSFLTPYSATEAASFFATTNNDDKDDDCEGGVCNIMGGRKSRRKRRNRRKKCKCKTRK